jgi:hypothetical protein
MSDVFNVIEKIRAYPNAQNQFNDILKLSAQICGALNHIRSKIILESAVISEEKEALITKSELHKQDIAQNLIITYLITFFAIEDLIEDRMLHDYKIDQIRLARILDRLARLSRTPSFDMVEDEMRMIQARFDLNQQMIEEVYFPKDSASQEAVFNTFYQDPILKPFKTPELAKQTVTKLSEQASTRNDLIKTGDWSSLKSDTYVKEKNNIISGLLNPNNNAYFQTQQGREIKRELQSGLAIMDFKQRLGAWDRTEPENRKPDEGEQSKLIRSIQNIYDNFKSELLTDYQAKNKSQLPEDKLAAENIKNQFSNLKNLTDILSFEQSEKYRDCLGMIYDLDNPDKNGKYKLKPAYEGIQHNEGKTVDYLSAAELDRLASVDSEELEVTYNKAKANADWMDVDLFTSGDIFQALNTDYLSNKVLKEEDIDLSDDFLKKSKPGILSQYNNSNKNNSNSKININNNGFMPKYDQTAQKLEKKINHYLRMVEAKLSPILDLSLPAQQKEDSIFTVLYQAHMRQNRKAPISQQDDSFLRNLAKDLAGDPNSKSRLEKAVGNKAAVIPEPSPKMGVNKNS